MKTEIEWAELHAPLFLAGTNLGQKLDPKKRTGLKMIYDEDKRHLYVIYNAQMARVPETSVLSMVERQVIATAKLVIESNDPVITPGTFNPHAAQVETPMSHVHAGPGAGQTGQEPPKRGPGRPPNPRGAA